MRRQAAAAVYAIAMGVVLVGDGRAALAWGQDGHVLVARIADKHLSAKAKQGVKALLDGRSLADIASWADDWKPTHPDTGPWHFVDIPLPADDYQEARDCPGRACVVAALDDQITKLAAADTPLGDRKRALRFVVHFVADLHQPLHDENNKDRGGNQVVARLVLPDPEFPFDSGPSSQLHGIWDSDLIDSAHRDQDAYVTALAKLPAPVKTMQAGTIVDWALEAHRLARDPGYALLPAADGTGTRRLGPDYVAKCRPVVELQLQRAGVRLARVLNEAFATPPATTAIGTPAKPPASVPPAPQAATTPPAAPR